MDNNQVDTFTFRNYTKCVSVTKRLLCNGNYQCSISIISTNNRPTTLTSSDTAEFYFSFVKPFRQIWMRKFLIFFFLQNFLRGINTFFLGFLVKGLPLFVACLYKRILSVLKACNKENCWYFTMPLRSCEKDL